MQVVIAELIMLLILQYFIPFITPKIDKNIQYTMIHGGKLLLLSFDAWVSPGLSFDAHEAEW
jgi:hypothetical protein